MINLRSVDLNLLPVFEAVYEESSLTSAAQRLSMSQPAVSNAVARLRTVFNDELFVRHGRGVHRTSTADAVYAKLHGALGTLRDSVVGRPRLRPEVIDKVLLRQRVAPAGAVAGRSPARAALERRAWHQTSLSAPDPGRSTSSNHCETAASMLPSTGWCRQVVISVSSRSSRRHGGRCATRTPSALKVRHEKDLRSLDFVGLRPRVRWRQPRARPAGMAAFEAELRDRSVGNSGGLAADQSIGPGGPGAQEHAETRARYFPASYSACGGHHENDSHQVGMGSEQGVGSCAGVHPQADRVGIARCHGARPSSWVT